MAPSAIYYSPVTAIHAPSTASSTNGPILVIGSLATAQDGRYQAVVESLDSANVERQLVDRLVDGAVSLEQDKFSAVHVVLAVPDYETLAARALSLFSMLLSSISPLGLLHISGPPSSENLMSDLTLTGFTIIGNLHGTLVAQKPSFSAGAAVSLKKSAASISLPRRSRDTNASKQALWTFTSATTPAIDPESLLTPEDHVRPIACEPSTNGAPHRKKACKGCTCGLAEIEEKERRTGKIVVLDGTEGGQANEVTASEKDRLVAAAKTSSKATSSCGSCFLGDAFRCASCPYLGLPAFKPGEKVEINFDSDDV